MKSDTGSRAAWFRRATAILALALGCEGGSAGLPPVPVSPLRVIAATRPTDGSLTGIADPYLQAVPVSGNPVSGAIAAGVQIEVPVEQTYFLEVTDGPTPARSGGVLVGDVVFASGVGSPNTSALFVDTSEVPIELGELRLAGGRVSPTTNPLDFVDANDDGVPDSQQVNTDPLRVLRVEPADGETDVERDEEIEIRFSLALDPATVGDATVRIEGPDGAIPIRIANEGDGEEAGRIEIEARDGFAASTTYTVVVTTGVESTDGRALASEFRSQFTTRARSSGSGSGNEDGEGSGGGTGGGSDDGGGAGGGSDDGSGGGSDDGSGGGSGGGSDDGSGGGSDDGSGGGSGDGSGGGSDDGSGGGSDDGSGGGSDDGSGGGSDDGSGGGSDDGSGGGSGGGSDDGSGGGTDDGSSGSDDGGEPAEPESFDETGTVVVISSTSITVGSDVWVITPDTRIIDDTGDVSWSAIPVGVTVEVKGVREVDGTLVAEEIEVKD